MPVEANDVGKRLDHLGFPNWNTVQTAATNITHELHMVWNNSQNFLDVSHATARIFRSGGDKRTKD